MSKRYTVLSKYNSPDLLFPPPIILYLHRTGSQSSIFFSALETCATNVGNCFKKTTFVFERISFPLARSFHLCSLMYYSKFGIWRCFDKLTKRDKKGFSSFLHRPFTIISSHGEEKGQIRHPTLGFPSR